MAIEFEKIKPLIKRASKRQDHYSFVFQTAFGEPVHSEYEENSKSGIFGSIRKSLAGIVGSETKEDKGPGLEDYYDDIRKAAVKAFDKVSERFKWNENLKEWTYVEEEFSMSGFEEFLTTHPLNNDLQKKLLIRILASIASADNEITSEEKAFLSDFFNIHENDLDKIINEGPPSIRELQDVEPTSIRETMIMIAWSIAMTDEEVDESERFSIGFYAGTMGIPKERTDELKVLAAHFVLEKAAEEIRFSYFDTNKDLHNELKERLFTISDHIGFKEDTRKDVVHRIINRQLAK